MKKQPSFKFPETITDPQEIIDHLTDEQFNALSQYIGQGAAEYYRSMIAELDRVEGQLRAAGEVIALNSNVKPDGEDPPGPAPVRVRIKIWVELISPGHNY